MDNGAPRFRVLLYAVALGMSYGDVAEELGMTIKAVSDVMGSPFMDEELKGLKKKIRKRVEDMASGEETERILASGTTEAARVLVDAVSSGDKRALGAAQVLLKGRGYLAERVEHVGKLLMPAEQLKALEGAREESETIGWDGEAEVSSVGPS